MHQELKTAACEALGLLPPSPNRDSMLAEIAGLESTGQERVAHVVKTVSPALEDQEWYEVSRFLEVRYKSRELQFHSYLNTATVVGASQEYDCRLSSNDPWTEEGRNLLAKWLKEWGELVNLGAPAARVAVY